MLGARSPAEAGAQMPGGPSFSFDRERATFLAAVLGQVRPVLASWEEAWGADADGGMARFYAPMP